MKNAHYWLNKLDKLYKSNERELEVPSLYFEQAAREELTVVLACAIQASDRNLHAIAKSLQNDADCSAFVGILVHWKKLLALENQRGWLGEPSQQWHLRGNMNKSIFAGTGVTGTRR